MHRMRRLVTIIAALGALLTLAGAAQARGFSVANADSGGGSDVTCAPCSTIAGALRKAAAAPGDDFIILGVGVYRGSFGVRDPARVALIGHGGRTAIAGNIDVGLPNGVTSYIPGGTGLGVGPGRYVQFEDLVLMSPAEAISANRVDIRLKNTSVNGSVSVVNAGAVVDRSTVVANACRPAVIIHVGDVGDAAHPLEIGNGDVISSVLQSTVIGHPAIAYRGSANVFENLYVNRAFVIAGRAGCPEASGQAITVGANGFAQISTVLIHAESTTASTAIAATDADVYAGLGTIFGAYDIGISAIRSRVTSQGMAIDGPPIAVDATGGGNQPLGTFQLDYTFASGQMRLGGFPVDLPTNRFATPLVTSYGVPQAGSPLLGAIPSDFRFNSVANGAYFFSFDGIERPQPFVVGGAPTYEAGAFEVAPSAPTLALPPSFVGPAWLPGRVVDGVPQADLGGIGLPAPAGAPAAGNAAAPGVAATADAAATATATTKVGPELIIQPPRRVVQGTTVVVRVKVPYRGRLTLRTYGERGGLVAVGKGRPVVKGWRKVKLTIGPNTRLGTLRIVATHVRPQTRALLTAANVTRVVKG